MKQRRSWTERNDGCVLRERMKKMPTSQTCFHAGCVCVCVSTLLCVYCMHQVVSYQDGVFM